MLSDEPKAEADKTYPETLISLPGEERGAGAGGGAEGRSRGEEPGDHLKFQIDRRIHFRTILLRIEYLLIPHVHKPLRKTWKWYYYF